MISENEKEKLRKEKVSGFFLDMAKFSFAGIVIGSMVSVTDQTPLLLVLCKAITGTLLTIVFARIGILMLKQ